MVNRPWIASVLPRRSCWLLAVFLVGCHAGLPIPPSLPTVAPAEHPELVQSTEIGLRSQSGIQLDWAIELGSPELIGRSFTGFECCLIAQLDDGRFARLDLEWTSSYSRPLESGLHRVRIGHSVAEVGGYAQRDAATDIPGSVPSIEGYQFVSVARIVQRRGHRFIGLWRSLDSETTLLVTFDGEGAAGLETNDYSIVATLAFEGAILMTAGSHHGGPAGIRIARNPDAEGDVELINLLWPR